MKTKKNQKWKIPNTILKTQSKNSKLKGKL